MFVRAYLRASTAEQDAERAKQSLIDFANSQGVKIAKFYVENESGAKLERPKLNELIDDCQVDEEGQGDILLLEDIDRLTRLTPKEWDILNGRLKAKSVKVVVIGLPLSHMWLKETKMDDMTMGIMIGMNEMMLQVLATVARNDYEKRRYRQQQGIAKAKEKGVYKGKQPNIKQYKTILAMIDTGNTYAQIIDTLEVGAGTIANAKKWRRRQITEAENKVTLFELSDLEQPIQVKKRRGRRATL